MPVVCKLWSPQMIVRQSFIYVISITYHDFCISTYVSTYVAKAEFGAKNGGFSATRLPNPHY
jgi:hypothetical protein